MQNNIDNNLFLILKQKHTHKSIRFIHRIEQIHNKEKSI